MHELVNQCVGLNLNNFDNNLQSLFGIILKHFSTRIHKFIIISNMNKFSKTSYPRHLNQNNFLPLGQHPSLRKNHNDEH